MSCWRLPSSPSQAMARLGLNAVICNKENFKMKKIESPAGCAGDTGQEGLYDYTTM